MLAPVALIDTLVGIVVGVVFIAVVMVAVVIILGVISKA